MKTWLVSTNRTRRMRSVSGASAADSVAAIELASEQPAGAGANDRSECPGASRLDELSEQAAGDAADDQSRCPIITSAVKATVQSTIDTVVATEPVLLITRPVITRPVERTIVPRRVVASLTRLEMSVVVVAP